MGVASSAASQAPSIPNSDMGTLIGWTGLGLGVVVLYGAVKGVPVFGKDGIITNAITEGKLTHVVKGSGGGTSTTTSGGKASNPAAKASQYLGNQATSLSGAGIQAITGTAPAAPKKPLSLFQQLFGYKPSNSSGGLLGDFERSSYGSTMIKANSAVMHGIATAAKAVGSQVDQGLKDAWNTFAHPFG